MLRDNVSEERRWTHEMKKRERLQIDEAMRHHMTNQNKLHLNGIVMMTTVKPVMSWEIDMKRVLQDKQYELYL